MGYPYSWQSSESAGITGPVPNSLKTTANTREFDLYGRSDSEIFYAGFTESDYKSLIRSSIQRILMTQPGERVMVPDFGCDIRRCVFEPNDSVLGSELESVILTALDRWEPRISVSGIDISRDDDHVIVTVPYTIKGTDLDDTVNYVFDAK